MYAVYRADQISNVKVAWAGPSPSALPLWARAVVEAATPTVHGTESTAVVQLQLEAPDHGDIPSLGFHASSDSVFDSEDHALFRGIDAAAHASSPATGRRILDAATANPYLPHVGKDASGSGGSGAGAGAGTASASATCAAAVTASAGVAAGVFPAAAGAAAYRQPTVADVDVCPVQRPSYLTPVHPVTATAAAAAVTPPPLSALSAEDAAAGYGLMMDCLTLTAAPAPHGGGAADPPPQRQQYYHAPADLQ